MPGAIRLSYHINLLMHLEALYILNLFQYMEPDEVKLNFKELSVVIYRTIIVLIADNKKETLYGVGACVAFFINRFLLMKVVDAPKDGGERFLSYLLPAVFIAVEVVVVFGCKELIKNAVNFCGTYYHRQKRKMQREVLEKVDENILIK